MSPATLVRTGLVRTGLVRTGLVRTGLVRTGQVLLVTLCLPGVASACAVCGGDPNGPRGEAYYDMTIFMSLFPLFAMGVIALWLYRQYTAVEDESATDTI